VIGNVTVDNNNNRFMALWDYPDEPVPEEIFTDSHLFWSSTILY